MSIGLLTLALAAALFALRPEIWARVFFARVDPRPAGLLRVAFGLVVLWVLLCFAPHVRLFFTDEGLVLPARGLDPGGGTLHAVLGAASLLQLRSDPPLVFALYGLALVSAVLMTLGVWTTVSTGVTWALAEQLYRYDAMFANGGDLVLRAFLFLALFCRWGEAYSIDTLRRRRRALLSGASVIPPLRAIPVWPLRLMMIQLALIYALNGWHKVGPGWQDGTALYYALNLDHFYRVPAQGVVTWLHHVGALPLLTWLTRAWELGFPLARLGVALRGYEADRRAGAWPAAAVPRRIASWLVLGAAGLAAFVLVGRPLAGGIALGAALVFVLLYRAARARAPRLFRFVLEWVLGKRLWLGFGVALHLAIDLGMNIGAFPQVMMATYLAWLTGPDVDRLWHLVLRGGPVVTVRHHPDETGVRQAALLRLREHAPRLAFAADPLAEPRALHVDVEGRRAGLMGADAALALVPLFPGLWWLRPFAPIRPFRRPAGCVALRLLASR
jgi:hypothetical protein